MNHAILVDDRIAVRRERAAKQHVGIEAAVLVKIDDAQIIGFVNSSVLGLQLAKQQAQQRALAATVRTNQANAHAGGDPELNFLKQCQAAEGKTNIIEMDELAGLAIGCGKIDFCRAGASSQVH